MDLSHLTQILLPAHNLRVIYLGVCSLGIAAGMLGCFLLFRKRSLLSDTVGHATLPGVAGGFLLSSLLYPGEGKNIFILMLGALVFGWLSVQVVQWMIQHTRLRQDAALAVSLTGFYALGVVLLSVIQKSGLPDSSGLEYYLYGMVASMVQTEAWILCGTAVAATLLTTLLLKELNALCFDEGYAQTQGLPHRWLDETLMTLCLIVAIVGLQTVGLLLIMALFIIPPATARLWTNSLKKTLAISALVGALGSLIGALVSSEVEHMPAGAAIILATSLLFFLSLLIGRRKGLLSRHLEYYAIERRLAENQYLRAVFDGLEAQQQVRLFCGLKFSRKLAMTDFLIRDTLAKRNWTTTKQSAITRSLLKQGLLTLTGTESAALTDKGLNRAIETAKTHRLTEMYLLEHAEVAQKNVHQYVERIEEITTPEIANDLRDLFEERLQQELIPQEPHEVK